MHDVEVRIISIQGVSTIRVAEADLQQALNDIYMFASEVGNESPLVKIIHHDMRSALEKTRRVNGEQAVQRGLGGTLCVLSKKA